MLIWKFIDFCKDDDTNNASKPDEIDNKSTSEKENLALTSREIDMDCASEVVEEIPIGYKNGNGSKDYDNGDGSFNTEKNNNITEKGCDY